MSQEKMKNTFKLLKKFFILISVVGLVGLLFCSVYIAKHTSLDRFVDVPTRMTPSHWAEHIKIGVIGDSWVAGQTLDRAIEQTMTASGFKTEVVSSGHPGAESRQIYRNLFLERNAEHSSNALLVDEDLDYLVVVAGVNDSAWHIGATFYAHHVFFIIKTVLARGIKPVIVEVPEYGIEETPSVGLLSWGKRTIYFWLFDDGKVDVIREYRKALRDKIPPAMADKVVFIEFASIADDYRNSKDLYANPSHLNRGGYKKLGNLIADSILESHNKANALGR